MNSNGDCILKEMRWFSDMNWDDLCFKKKISPFIPAIDNITDLSNFDP